MGIVYKALDRRLDRTVAVKFLPRHMSVDAEARERFLKEAKAAAVLDHPNICTIHEINEAPDGRMFIVMSYYAGETLKDKIPSCGLPAVEALQISLQITEALSWAHQRGIVHRDIKPANVIILEDGSVKLLDFGLAKNTNATVTAPGTVMGTLTYMSPEQVRGEEVSGQTDLWSLGVMLYEMLVGARAFPGATPQAVMYSILNSRPAPLSARQPGLPASLERVLQNCLAKETADRYSDARALKRDLQSLLADLREQTGAADSPSPPETRQPGISGETVRLFRSEGARLNLTVVVSNLSGYAALIESLDPEESGQMLDQLAEEARRIVERHGGVVNESGEERLVCFFGLPEPHEDDFLRAVQATRELHEMVQAAGSERTDLAESAISLRSGIDSGSVIALRRTSGSYRITGDCSRAAEALFLGAGSDQVLVSPRVRRLITPFYETEATTELPLKGSQGAILPHQVLKATGLETRLEAAELVGLTTYVGREAELGEVRGCLDRSRAGLGQVMALVGEAGLGKSRLLFELGRELTESGHRWIQAGCDSQGEATSYLPFSRVLKRLLKWQQIGESERADEIVRRVEEINSELTRFVPIYLQLLALQDERYPVPDHLEGDDLRLAMIQALLAVFTLSAREDPLVFMLEDWHWADEASRAVLDQMVELVPAFPLALIVTYRPEFSHSWSNLANLNTIRLQPLDQSEVAEVVAAVLNAHEVPEELASLLHERTSGNPFYLEEVTRALREEGLLKVDDRRAFLTRSAGRLEIPDTVQAVIRTRLHRISPFARSVLRLASVIGAEFSYRLLESVLQNDPQLADAREELREIGLIQQVQVLPEAAFRFKHVLTQEVAYDSLLRHQRKRLHRAGRRGNRIALP